MARSLPGLRSLYLDRSYLPREQLLAILAGCRELREFSGRGCVPDARSCRASPPLLSQRMPTPSPRDVRKNRAAAMPSCP